jgi:hypothetical protein
VLMNAGCLQLALHSFEALACDPPKRVHGLTESNVGAGRRQTCREFSDITALPKLDSERSRWN